MVTPLEPLHHKCFVKMYETNMNTKMICPITIFKYTSPFHHVGHVYLTHYHNFSLIAPEVVGRQRYGRPVDCWAIGVIMYIL